ncbi:hypothetical protein BROUX41_002240 [Berkeleyomyces rouxiae]|uniref:uncharacterized protein n=1 Tax=Berkeleyomyces rouxiae TaxID=2035830 RepID=UPI003B7E2C67
MPHIEKPPQSSTADQDTSMDDSRFDKPGIWTPAILPEPAGLTDTQHTSNPLPTEFPVLKGLPRQRHQPLREGFQQASFARRFVDACLMNIQQRNLRQLTDLLGGTTAAAEGEKAAYKSFAEVCEDADRIVNFLWYTGSPFLQIPYLFDLIVEFTELAETMGPAPIPTLIVLRKLDHVFASLTCQKNIATGEVVVGTDSYSMTQTDIVRLQAIISEVRSKMWEKLNKAEPAEGISADEEDDDDDYDDDDLECTFDDKPAEVVDVPLPGVTAEQTQTSVDGSDWRPPKTTTELELAVAQIFEQTLVVVNEKLGDGI